MVNMTSSHGKYVKLTSIKLIQIKSMSSQFVHYDLVIVILQVILESYGASQLNFGKNIDLRPQQHVAWEIKNITMKTVGVSLYNIN